MSALDWRRPEHYVDGWRDRYCVICGAGPATCLFAHYSKVHGRGFRELGLSLEQVASADYIANKRAQALDRDSSPSVETRALVPLSELRRYRSERRRRWATAAKEEMNAGAGYGSRLAKRWKCNLSTVYTRIASLQERGLLPPPRPARENRQAARLLAHKATSRIARERKERRAAEALAEMEAGPGYTRRLAAKWEIGDGAVRTLLSHLRREELLPPSTRGAPAHGTATGGARHRRLGEPLCDACLDAFRADRRRRYAERREVVLVQQAKYRARRRQEASQ